MLYNTETIYAVIVTIGFAIILWTYFKQEKENDIN